MLTAGAVAVATQVPLPDSIAGVVYDDTNLNNQQDAGEPGIGGVTLDALPVQRHELRLDRHDDRHRRAGQLQVHEPAAWRIPRRRNAARGYFSVGATAGTVDGAVAAR